MTKTADAIVIGAGIVGASTAYQLARTGRRVALVDQGAGAGYGSSSASSGIIRFEYTLPTSVVVAWEASHMWADLRSYLQAPAGEELAEFHRNGKIMLDCPAFPRAALRAHFDALGIEYEEWDADELERRIGGIDAGKFYPPKPIDSDSFWDDPHGRLGAVYTPQAGFIDDPRLACENFANAARRAGAETLYRTEVTAITPVAGTPDSAGPAGATTWRVDTNTGAVLEAPLLVNAAGPWSPEVNALAGVGAEFAITTRPLRQEVHAVPAPAGFNPTGSIGPCVADQDLGYYLRPEPSGSLVIGGTEPECDQLEWVTGPLAEVNMNRTAELFDKQVTRAGRRFPALAIPPRPAGVVGIYDVATDWTPIYDKTAATGFFVAIGTSGNQFKNGPIIGEFMAAIIAATDAGADHDTVPVQYSGRVSGRSVDLGFYSRLRAPAANSGTVAG
ncbi:MAG: FAD-binding oxidoreductase [Bifidobacteriaceae bacterium]|jgi:glycine/D-amino acid oxidase-like deaminating enzyme|nr:FAD-binding oxidoreductase [Bifidobacteriaceae bacterium]